MDIQRVDKLPPPRPALGLRDALEVVLGQLPRQIEERHCNGLRLPLQAQHCAQAGMEGGERGSKWLWF